MKPLKTVIGSFPQREHTKAYSHEKAIQEVVELQLRYGIDIVTDGEQREDLIGYFEQIPGLKKIDKRLGIVGKIEPMENPNEFYKILDSKLVRSYLEHLNRNDVKIKIPITGPITLGVTSALAGLDYYKNILDQRIYSDCSEALTPLAKKVLHVGAYLQIDEPGLSGGYVSPKIAGDILKDFFSFIPDSVIDEGRVSLHVCGAVRDVFYKELLRLNLGIISLAFSGAQESKNIEVVTKESLQDNGKKLAAGFISNIAYEEKDVALKRLYTIAEKVGRENLAQVHPDCGFGGTDPNLVELILRTMEKATDEFSLSN
jgi:5-methyltetrahydropteroyltriglutamate--homocysteine methyltransferase